MYMRYTIDKNLILVNHVSRSYTQRLTPWTTTVPLCTVHWSISTGLRVANEIA